jgi:hypothetical protein
MTTIEDVMECGHRYADATGSTMAAEQALRAAIEQYAAERVAEADSEIKCLRAERDHARAKVDNAVKLLVSIHSCMYPSAVKTADGRLMVFRPENPHEYMQALSDRIRAIPDGMVAHGIWEQQNG